MAWRALQLRDLTIDPPLLNAAGAFDVDAPDAGWRASPEPARQLGAYVTKTVTLSPRAGNPEPRIDVAPGRLRDSLVNSVGLANPGIDAVLAAGGGVAATLGVPVVLSIGGSTRELATIVERIGASSPSWIAALELNLSCPNDLSHAVVAAASELAVEEAVAVVRAGTDLPVVAKLTAACADIGPIARAAQRAGADAISAVNSLPVRAVDDEGRQLLGTIDGGLTGVALHPVALRCVARAAQATSLPVIGIGGIDSPAAARRMLAAGAAAIGVGTAAALVPSVLFDLARELRPHATLQGVVPG